jgi:leucyl aminopeptidase
MLHERYTYITKHPDNIPQYHVIVKSVDDDANINTAVNESNPTLTIDLHKPFISMRQVAKSLPKNKSICLCVTKLPTKYKYAFLTYASKALYTFQKYIKKGNVSTTNKIYVFDQHKQDKAFKSFVCSLNCADVARDLQNEPANVMSPSVFVATATNILEDAIASTHNNNNKSNKSKSKAPTLKVKVLDDDQMKKEQLNLVLAVGMSSIRKPKFMIVECIHSDKCPTVCLIGKTVLFDSGGLNIKTRGMLPEMKTDKTGGTVLVALIRYCILNNVKLNIIGAMPIVENLLGENVTRPGDIVTSHSGKTVEITDVDAEGRLIIADAISYLVNYCKKYKPDYIVDFATLTGWADSVHLDLNAVCYCRDMKLAAKLNKIGEQVGERIWFLPPWDEYTYFTKSVVANTRNYSLDVKEGAYLPAMFMINFVPEDMRDKWVHFDICNNFSGDLARGNCVLLASQWLHQIK